MTNTMATTKDEKFQLRSKVCRYGTFYYYGVDEFVGLSLDQYGEYSEFEVLVMRKVLKEGDVAINVGANIGALTVPMSQLVGKTGKVLAFEPGAENARLLTKNLVANHCANTLIYNRAVSDKKGTVRVSSLDALGHKNFGRVEVNDNGDIRVETVTIDGFNLEAVKFMLIDVEGFESKVIHGAAETIKRCRPIIMVENDRQEKSQELIATIYDLGYRCYWFRPPLFNPDNFAKNQRNVFNNIVSLNMICVPDESPWSIEGCEDVADIRNDDLMFLRERDRYQKRVDKNPDDLEARLMVAHYSNMMQDEQTAFAALNENLRRDPHHVKSLAIEGLLRLQRGDWSAWPTYELRFSQSAAMRAFYGTNRTFPVPQWDGEPTDQPVLIWSEQGFGDQIMFVRFMSKVLDRAPNAFLETPASMYELFLTSGVSPNGLYRLHRTLPYYDRHCSITSLPAVLGLTSEFDLKPDPAQRLPRPFGYLFPDPGLVDHWASRKNPRLGICIAGSPRSERPYTRDIPQELIEPILVKHGPWLNLVQNGQFYNFAETAAAILNCDLVVTVDTSIAHLAGALGVETWLLLSFDPDWRWGLKSERTVWYDSVRIFRQPKFRDWKSVVEMVDVELDKRTAADNLSQEVLQFSVS